MPYNVELCYGYFEGECGIYHAFRLVAPEKDFPDDVEKSLTESLETKADNPNFKWDCMHLNLPDAIVERIKADGVREYLTAQKGEHQDIQRSVDQQNDARAGKKFGGIMAFVGNGGMDKLIGVEGEGETISADEAPVFDDYMEE